MKDKKFEEELSWVWYYFQLYGCKEISDRSEYKTFIQIFINNNLEHKIKIIKEMKYNGINWKEFDWD